VEGFCEHGDEVLEYLHNCRFLKKGSAPCVSEWVSEWVSERACVPLHGRPVFCLPLIGSLTAILCFSVHRSAPFKGLISCPRSPYSFWIAQGPWAYIHITFSTFDLPTYPEHGGSNCLRSAINFRCCSRECMVDSMKNIMEIENARSRRNKTNHVGTAVSFSYVLIPFFPSLFLFLHLSIVLWSSRYYVELHRLV
jgi:hypothetical protein